MSDSKSRPIITEETEKWFQDLRILRDKKAKIMVDIDSIPKDEIEKMKEVLSDNGRVDIECIPEPEPCQEGSYDSGRRERCGNNRYHVPKALAKRKRQLARKSKQINRKK